MNRITFEDKKPQNLNINSKYIMTSQNANEIKHVFNSMIDFLEISASSFSDSLRFINFNIRSQYLEENEKYILKIEISDNDLFIGCLELDSKNSNDFLIFKNTSFIPIHSLSKSNKKISIFVDLNKTNLDEFKSNKYFIRLHLINETSNEIFKTFGAILGSFEKCINGKHTSTHEIANSVKQPLDIYPISLSATISSKMENNNLLCSVSNIKKINSDFSETPISLDLCQIRPFLNDNEIFEKTETGFKLSNIKSNYTRTIILTDQTSLCFFPFNVTPSAIFSINVEDNIPNNLNYDDQVTLSVNNIFNNGSKESSLDHHYLTFSNIKNSNGSLSYESFKNKSYYGYVSYDDNEKLIRLSKMKLVDIILKDINGNDLKIIDDNYSYDFNPFAIFKQNENELIEYPIPKEDVSFSNFNDVGFTISNFILKTNKLNNDLIDSINIKFNIKNNIFNFTKPIFIRKRKPEILPNLKKLFITYCDYPEVNSPFYKGTYDRDSDMSTLKFSKNDIYNTSGTPESFINTIEIEEIMTNDGLKNGVIVINSTYDKEDDWAKLIFSKNKFEINDQTNYNEIFSESNLSKMTEVTLAPPNDKTIQNIKITSDDPNKSTI